LFSHIDGEIGAGRFRADLLYRLNTIHIHIPPLRERGDDIVLLGQRSLNQHAQHHGRAVTSFSEAALSALRRYPWPGNVRELNHVVERAVLMARGSAIEPADLRLTAAPVPGDRRPMTLDEVELDAIRGALARHDGNVVAAADELGMSRSALYRRMEKFGL
jgi:DNA-binding NtrC family response regulator